ncbi:MAG: hypothetical protein ICV73_14820 [Acetobacteraceae bacterium]|nr:hypothetical protein [Acetobacteraceae bacterium]
MPVVRYWGSVPASIAEGSRAGDWVANLGLGGDLSRIVAIETVGPEAGFFSATWNAALGTATLRPNAVLDFESFSAAGALPQVEIGLRFVFDDGTRQEGGASYRVAVLDRDDTAPDSLSFDGGGTVAAGEIGATIGTLSVSDPDSAGPFHFSFAPEDEWRFEVVDGGVLKLRDGVSLGLDDVPTLPVLVQVSDGTQSAAFVLDVKVTNPAGAADPVPAVPPVLAAGETRSGFALAGPREALTARRAEQAPAVTAEPGGARHVVLDGGGEVWLGPGVDRVRFADGWLGAAGEGSAAQAAALHRAVFGEDADGVALAPIVAELRAGAGWAEVAQDLLDAAPALSALEDAHFVSALCRAALDSDPGAADLALYNARLAAGGVARAQVVADIALSPAALAKLAAEAAPAGGHWVADPFDPAADLPARPTFDDTHPTSASAGGSPSAVGWFM